MGAHRNPIYDEAYRDLYLAGMSLDQVARRIGVTRQCVYKAFKQRGFMLRTVEANDFQMYDGKKFTLKNHGYYALTTNDRCLMHRYIWEKEAAPKDYPLHKNRMAKVEIKSGRAMTEDDIINAVCEVCGITPGDLKTRTRREPIPTARALIAHFLYRELHKDAREIVRYIGHPGVDRTSAYHYLPDRRKGKQTLVEDRMPYQKKLRKLKEEIERILE